VHRHLRHIEIEGTLPPIGTEMIRDDGAVAGHITSAAGLPLASGDRNFALGMIRGEAELRNETLKYTAGTAAGTARILTAPPSFASTT
jgi:hypothetical protein